MSWAPQWKMGRRCSEPSGGDSLGGVRVGEPSGWMGSSSARCRRRNKGNWVCSVWIKKRETSGVIFLLSISLWLEDTEKTKRLFREVRSNSMRSCGSNLKYAQFKLNIRKLVFTSRIIRTLSQVPAEDLESPSLEMFSFLIIQVPRKS